MRGLRFGPARGTGRLRISLALAAALVAACTGGDDTSDRDPRLDDAVEIEQYTDAVATVLRADADQLLGLAPAEIACAAREVTATVGIDRWRELGSPESVRRRSAGDLSGIGLSVDERIAVELAASRCGGAATERAYIGALVPSIDEAGLLGLTETDRTCIATGTVDVLGLAALRAVGSPGEVARLADEDLSALQPTPDQVDAVVERYVACVPDVDDRYIAALGEASADLDPVCLRDTLTLERLRQILRELLVGTTAAYQATLAPCVTTETSPPQRVPTPLVTVP